MKNSLSLSIKDSALFILFGALLFSTAFFGCSKEKEAPTGTAVAPAANGILDFTPSSTFYLSAAFTGDRTKMVKVTPYDTNGTPQPAQYIFWLDGRFDIKDKIVTTAQDMRITAPSLGFSYKEGWRYVIETKIGQSTSPIEEHPESSYNYFPIYPTDTITPNKLNAFRYRTEPPIDQAIIVVMQDAMGTLNANRMKQNDSIPTKKH